MPGPSAESPPVPSENEYHPRGYWHIFLRFLSRFAAIFLFDIRCYHVSETPRSGGVIFAANHQSFIDPILIGISQRRLLFYLARDTLFRSRLSTAFLKSLNTWPVARESHSPRQGIDICLRALRAGQPLLLFPEGTRTSDGAMGKLKRGIALIARQSGCPVVPVYVDGAFEVWPRHRLLPRQGPIRLFVGSPLPSTPSGPEKKLSSSGKSSGDPRENMHDRSNSASGSAPERAGNSPAGWSGPADRKIAAATLLEELEEAYRVLREEAMKRRTGFQL